MVVKINLLAPRCNTRPFTWTKDPNYGHARRDTDLRSSFIRLKSAQAALQAHFQRDFLRRKNALILGMGRVFEEADMLLKYFSGMRRLHIVEWDPDKAAAIRRHFARQTYDGRIRVHLADARDMRRINDERIHLAYFSALLDLHHESVSEVRLLLEISRVLSGKGFAFSLDFMLYNRQNDLSLLRNVGLDRLNNKVVCRKSTEASKKT